MVYYVYFFCARLKCSKCLSASVRRTISPAPNLEHVTDGEEPSIYCCRNVLSTLWNALCANYTLDNGYSLIGIEKGFKRA